MVTGSKATRTFLSTAFWVVGAYSVYWETTVIAAAHRFRDVELPLIGECSQVEAIILTLSVFWCPLLVLHLILHCFQRVVRQQGEGRPRFPGTIGDDDIPAELKIVRVFLFIVLFLWPTAAHIFLTGRAFAHFQIVPSDIADRPKSEWRSLAGFWNIVRFPCVTPEGSQRTEAFWWVNGVRTELREETPDQTTLETQLMESQTANAPEPAKTSKAQESGPRKNWKRVKLTALWLQPFAFAAVVFLAVWSSLIAFVNGFYLRGIPWGANRLLRWIGVIRFLRWIRKTLGARLTTGGLKHNNN